MPTYLIAHPDMTSNTAPSGACATDQVFNGLAAFRAFDRSLGFPCGIGSGNFPKNPDHWIEYDFQGNQKIDAYKFYGGSSGYYPTDWRFQGWDGAWVDLDVVTGNTSGETTWSDIFVIDSPSDTYTRYRLLFSDWAAPPDNLDVLLIGEIQLLTVAPTYDLPVADFSFDPQPVYKATGDFFPLPSLGGAFIFNAASITVGPVSLALPVTAMTFDPNSLALTLYPSESMPNTTIYRCYLDTLEIPISSIQARYRDGTASSAESYLSVVVPNGPAYADEIAARSSGVLSIKRGSRLADGSETLVTLMSVDLETIRDDFGGNSRSITLSGHSTFSNTTSKSITLQNVSYRFGGGSSPRRFRGSLDLNLRPGDSAVYGFEQIVVGAITYIVSPSGETMEITEAQ